MAIATTAEGVSQKVNNLMSKGAKRKSKRHEGHPDEKMFMNFQTTKGAWRAFERVCEDNSINQSEFLRKCMEILVESGGNTRGAIAKIEKYIGEMKFKKGSTLSKV